GPARGTRSPRQGHRRHGARRVRRDRGRRRTPSSRALEQAGVMSRPAPIIRRNPMRSNVSFGGMVVTVLALGPGASAQEPTPVKFSGTPVTAAHEFSSITALRDLSDGRVLVTDSK